MCVVFCSYGVCEDYLWGSLFGFLCGYCFILLAWYIFLGVLIMCVWVVGHRGFPYRFPENSVASFLGALLYGGDGVEFDVWLSRDGVPVVIHDRRTGRVSDVDLDVKESGVAELKRVYLGMGQVVPTLEEVLDALPRDKLVIVEIKDVDAIYKVYELVKSRNMLDNTVFVSFDFDALKKIRELDEKARIGFNIGDIEAAKEALKLKNVLNAYSVALPVTAPAIIGWETVENYIKEAKSLGYKIALWSPMGSKPEETLEFYMKLKELYDYAIINDLVNEGKAIREPW